MEKAIVVRYGELFLKGRNKKYFENLLTADIKYKLKDLACVPVFERNRCIVTDYSENLEQDIIDRLLAVFGITSLSRGILIENDLDQITKAAVDYSRASGSFKISAHRADKRFPFNSMEIAREVGGGVLDAYPNLKVDLHNPDFVIYVDVRDTGKTIVFGEKIKCAGGMPLGSAGKGMLMLSGGIDSPVAGYLAAKRGVDVSAVHFHSYPYTSLMAKEKVVTLAKMLTKYTNKMKLHVVSFTEIQEAIHKYCDPSYMITVMRRIMIRVVERLCKRTGSLAIVTGESLGQVASQTLHSMNVINEAAKSVPILRPLITMDKSEIIDISKMIGTFETSIQPYEDCCTVFLPENPVIKPTLEQAVEEENKIPELDEMITKAALEAELIRL